MFRRGSIALRIGMAVLIGGGLLALHAAKDAPLSAGFGKLSRKSPAPTATSEIPTPKPDELSAADASGPVESVEIPLVRTATQQINGAFASADFFVRLPEHIRFAPGSQIRILYRPSPILIPDICTMTLIVNGMKVDSRRVVTRASASEAVVNFTAPVREDAFKLGWNKITVACLLQTTTVACRDVDNPATWVALERGSVLKLAYRRSALFPELQRFPHCVTEEQLLHPDPLSPHEKEVAPAMTIFTPSRLDDPALRAFAIVSARLGQSGYVNEHHVVTAPLAEWPRESQGRGGVILARRDETGGLPLPNEVRASLSSLRAGQGIVAEFFTGAGASRRRWILVSGSDDAGFENAALTLGDGHALATARTNPIVVEGPPVIPSWVERRAHPGDAEVSLRRIGPEQIKFQGVFRNEQSIEWQLPPGYETRAGSEIELQFCHSQALQKPASAIEIAMNGTSVGSVALTPENAEMTTVRIPIPSGIAGRDPTTITFRSYLDIGTVDCGHRNEESAWLVITGDSKLRLKTAPVEIRGLERLRDAVMSDYFLRRTALVVPASPGPSELGMIQTIVMQLGAWAPSAPVLWPQVTARRDGGRLQGRTALVLGSASQWSEQVGDATLGIHTSAQSPGSVSMQGRTMEVSAFEPSLTFAQMIPSPWSKGNVAVVAGGWNAWATPTLQRLLTDPVVLSRLAGNLAAVDVKGRVVAYNTNKSQQESFSDRILRFAGSGETAEDSLVQHNDYETRQRWYQTHAVALTCVVGGLLAGAVWFQTSLFRRRERRRRAENKPEE